MIAHYSTYGHDEVDIRLLGPHLHDLRIIVGRGGVLFGIRGNTLYHPTTAVFDLAIGCVADNYLEPLLDKLQEVYPPCGDLLEMYLWPGDPK